METYWKAGEVMEATPQTLTELIERSDTEGLRRLGVTLMDEPQLDVFALAAEQLGVVSEPLATEILFMLVECAPSLPYQLKAELLTFARSRIESDIDDMRWLSAQALGAFDGERSDADRVLPLLEDSSPHVRWSAFETLVRLDPDAARAAAAARLTLEGDPLPKSGLMAFSIMIGAQRFLPTELFTEQWDWETKLLFFAACTQFAQHGDGPILALVREGCERLLAMDPPQNVSQALRRHCEDL